MPALSTTRPVSAGNSAARAARGRKRRLRTTNRNTRLVFLRAPLCPAGHLPHLGGDRLSRLFSPTSNVAEWAVRPKLPISPQVGEMPGRAEGGATECKANRDHAHWLFIT